MADFWNYKSYDVLPMINSILPKVENTKPQRGVEAHVIEVAPCSKGYSYT